MHIEHDISRHRFFVHLPDGDGELFYRPAGAGVLELWHTEVSSTLRGQGVGGALVRFALDYARASHLKVSPTCPYVTGWLKAHAEYQDLVAGATR